MTWTVKNKRQGIGIAVVLLALMVLGSVAGAMILITSGHLMSAHSSQQSLEAVYAARAGAYTKLGQVRSGDLKPASGKLPSERAFWEAVVFESGSKERNVPEDCLLVESTGYVIDPSTGAKLRSRKVAILANITASRWTHAAFGNNQVQMKSGSYTDAWDSENPLLLAKDLDHSKASIATNNPKQGVEIEDKDTVVIGWANSTIPNTNKKKKKKESSEVELKPHADVMGPPGSVEKQTVKGDQGKDRAYKNFVTASQEVNMDPVVMPTNLPVHNDVGLIDLGISPFPTVDVLGEVPLKPGAYHDLRVEGENNIAILDVSHMDPGSTAEYIFRGIHLNGGMLQVLQPPMDPLNPNPVTVKVYLDTGMKPNVDPLAGVHMEGAAVINPSTKPVHLQFLIAGEGRSVLEGSEGEDMGSPEAYYVAYAPQADLIIKRGALYGAVMANNVTLEGDKDGLVKTDKLPAVIHFDINLLDDEENPPVFNVLSVRYY